jgi:hypothetical protein
VPRRRGCRDGSTRAQYRFLDEPDEDAITELEGLREYITKNLEAQDAIKAGVLSATQRLQKLLTAKDKKQCILDMAAVNEIDLALIQLLQQNIDSASAAGQEDVAGFMTKVRDAASKYVIMPQHRSDAAAENADEIASRGRRGAADGKAAGDGKGDGKSATAADSSVITIQSS